METPSNATTSCNSFTYSYMRKDNPFKRRHQRDRKTKIVFEMTFREYCHIMRRLKLQSLHYIQWFTIKAWRISFIECFTSLECLQSGVHCFPSIIKFQCQLWNLFPWYMFSCSSWTLSDSIFLSNLSNSWSIEQCVRLVINNLIFSFFILYICHFPQK